MTKSENIIEATCLEAGCWPRDVRTQIVEQSGRTADELAKDPAALKSTIEKHRSEKPEGPAAQRMMKMAKACYRQRDKSKGLQLATSRALSRVRGAEKGAA